MIKFLVLGIVIAAAVMLFRKQKVAQPAKEIATDMKKDPICGTYVEADSKYQVKYYDNYYSFCSQECMEKFKAEKAGKDS